MRNLKQLVAFTLCVMVISACDELITTQRDKPNFIFEGNKKSLAPDGTSHVLVTLQFHRRLVPSQSIDITTSNGLLVKLPVTDFTNGTQLLEVNPNSDEYKFILVSSSTPDCCVLLSVKLNNIIANTNFEFK